MRGVAAIALVLSVGCTPAMSETRFEAPGDYHVSLRDQGVERSVTIHLPPGGTSGRALLLGLHGGGSSGAELSAQTGFDELADREGFVAAYPDGMGGPHGLGRAWNAGSCCSFAYFSGVDDRLFLLALLERLERRFALDPDRIYLVGYSNGGAMAQQLAATRGERFAAMGLFAATLPGSGRLEAPRRMLPNASLPPSVILIHGTADPHVPFGGRRSSDGSVDVSFLHGGQYYATRAACRQRGPWRSQHQGLLRRRSYRDCRQGREVDVLVLRGWGHDWPSRGRIEGCFSSSHPLSRFDAAEAMWSFFEGKRRPGAD